MRLNHRYVPGASLTAQYLLEPIRQDPGTGLEYAPLHRYAREVWYATATAQTRPTDCLTLAELTAAYRVAMNADCVSPLGRSRRATTPVVAAIHAARLINWHFHGRCTLVNASGDSISPIAGSPALLKHTCLLH